MGIVKVVNVNNSPYDFLCDRTSPLGNPKYLHDERDRGAVCDYYETYFAKNLNPDVSKEGFLEMLDEILQAAKTGDVLLGCHCFPKRCHVITIRDWVVNELKKEQIRLKE